MIKVIIVDDQPLIREGLATLLGLREDVEVVGMAKDGLEAFEKVKELTPDIVLMDIRMPGTSGVEGAGLITQYTKNTKVLMLTTFKDHELIFDALEEGASGYLLKDMSTDTIIQAIRTVHAGGIVLPPEITSQMLKELKHSKGWGLEVHTETPEEVHELTERELEVLRALGLGLSNKEIAEQLFITEGTTKNHVSNIISKLGIRDRTQAAIFAVRYGITSFDE